MGAVYFLSDTPGQFFPTAGDIDQPLFVVIDPDHVQILDPSLKVNFDTLLPDFAKYVEVDSDFTLPLVSGVIYEFDNTYTISPPAANLPQPEIGTYWVMNMLSRNTVRYDPAFGLGTNGDEGPNSILIHKTATGYAKVQYGHSPRYEEKTRFVSWNPDENSTVYHVTGNSNSTITINFNGGTLHALDFFEVYVDEGSSVTASTTIPDIGGERREDLPISLFSVDVNNTHWAIKDLPMPKPAVGNVSCGYGHSI